MFGYLLSNGTSRNIIDLNDFHHTFTLSNYLYDKDGLFQAGMLGLFILGLFS